MNQTFKIILPILTLLLTSCEGFKVLALHNVSDASINITVKPSIGNFDARDISNYPNYQYLDSTTVILKPDSSMILLSIFTGLMFNVNISEDDLRTDYLRIETKTDTIVADSKKEIIKLMDDNRMKYRRKTDKNRVMANGPNFGNIFIRE